jgi:hypothetical protein
MVEGEVVLTYNNHQRLLLALGGRSLNIDISPGEAAIEVSRWLTGVTVGQVAVAYGLPPDLDGIAPERAYPNADS